MPPYCRPCPLESRGFGKFRPIEVPDSVASIGFNHLREPGEYALLEYLVRSAEVAIRAAAHLRFHVGQTVIFIHNGQEHRGTIVLIGRRRFKIAERFGLAYSVASDLVRAIPDP